MDPDCPISVKDQESATGALPIYTRRVDSPKPITLVMMCVRAGCEKLKVLL